MCTEISSVMLPHYTLSFLITNYCSLDLYLHGKVQIFRSFSEGWRIARSCYNILQAHNLVHIPIQPW